MEYEFLLHGNSLTVTLPLALWVLCIIALVIFIAILVFQKKSKPLSPREREELAAYETMPKLAKELLESDQKLKGMRIFCSIENGFAAEAFRYAITLGAVPSDEETADLKISLKTFREDPLDYNFRLTISDNYGNRIVVRDFDETELDVPEEVIDELADLVVKTKINQMEFVS